MPSKKAYLSPERENIEEEFFKTFVVPDKTRMEEHTIVVDGDIIVGNHSEIKYGIISNSSILGERVQLSGDLISRADVRIDIWSQMGGNVKTDSNAYIGEFVTIDGKLVVKGDLDIGNDVRINGGFEARGWIVVRNPIPVMVYLFLYISELLRLGKDEEVEKALEDLFDDEDLESIGANSMIIPNGSRISMDAIRVPSKAVIGNDCRLVGNIRATSLEMADRTTLYGSIRTIQDVVLGKNDIIHGNIISRGTVYIAEDTHVLGEINAQAIKIHESARVDGVMRAPDGIVFEREEERIPGEKELLELNV
ncbi:polymer-forming cytoskeletal protein [Methanolobus halotolerans]|uniref:Acyltransferase n=1 Tax=Methanolobus halotolerans TaxID=2052935 RepID=A0A4E0R174_9EURY|nr:polymer-forming cytoskeletal protein [Methanolobus halotolerans]TGC10899.1 acyltransferase [Methanolobus halotolerans]